MLEEEEYLILGRVIDGTGAPCIENGAVGVVGQHIDWVGPLDQLPERWRLPQVTRLDHSTSAVMPGLVDGHTHLSFGEAQSEEELAFYGSVEYRAIRAGYLAGKALRAGVTSAHEASSSYNISVAIRDAIQAGMVEGPRLSAAGRQITTHQGLEDPFPSWVAFPSGVPGVLVRNQDEILEAVRLQVKDGVDVVKVSGSADAAFTNAPLSGAAFRQEELDLLADEVHRLERHCSIHARTAESVRLAARAGFDWIFHASFMDDEGLDLVGERGIPIVPTLTLLVNIVDASHNRFGVGGADAFKHEIDAASEILSRAHREGITIVAGSESGLSIVPFGEWHAREMEIFVTHLGMSPLEAIKSATSSAALTLPAYAMEIGALEAGRRADILVVQGDPLKDISILQRRNLYELVIKDGRSVELTPPPERRVMDFERTRIFHSGRFVYDDSTGQGSTVD